MITTVTLNKAEIEEMLTEIIAARMPAPQGYGWRGELEAYGRSATVTCEKQEAKTAATEEEREKTI